MSIQAVMTKADVCELLCSLKGSPLSVLLAMWLLKHRLGEVTVGTSDLCDYTGYSENTVRKGISRLHKLGLVRSLPQRYHGWALTESAGQLMLPVGDPQNLSVPKNFETGEAQNLSVEAQNLSVPAHVHVHEQVSKEDISKDHVSLEKEALEAVKVLVSEGAYPEVAEKRVRLALAGGWSEARVLEELECWLAYARHPRGRNIGCPWGLASKRVSENKPVSPQIKEMVEAWQAQAEAQATATPPTPVNAVDEAGDAWEQVKAELALQMTKST